MRLLKGIKECEAILCGRARLPQLDQGFWPPSTALPPCSLPAAAVELLRTAVLRNLLSLLDRGPQTPSSTCRILAWMRHAGAPGSDLPWRRQGLSATDRGPLPAGHSPDRSGPPSCWARS